MKMRKNKFSYELVLNNLSCDAVATLLIKHWFFQGQTSLYILLGHLLAAVNLRESYYKKGGFSILVKTGIISNEINLGNY